MSKDAIQPWAVGLTMLLLAAAALGYFFAPAAMLSVVGIVATSEATFFVRTLAAAFVGLLPMAWMALRRDHSANQRRILLGLAIYLVVGSAVDLHAYLGQIVGTAALPSVGFRTALGLVLGWLALP